MSLKIHTEIVNTLQYRDLESFVKEVTGRDFCFVSTQEASNGDVYRTIVDGQLTDSDREAYAKWLAGSDVAILYQTHILLNRLYIDGHIPSGTYIIEVDW